MAFSEIKKKCQQYSINLFRGGWKLSLVTRGALSKKNWEALSSIITKRISEHFNNFILQWIEMLFNNRNKLSDYFV